MKKAFTVIELIAVIVVLAIILAIAVPGITGIIRSSTMKAVESDAKLVLDSIRIKKLEDDTFNPLTLNESNVSNLLGLSNENYSDLEIKINEGQTYIKITGQGKWTGFSACGTYFDMKVNEGDCYLDFNPPTIVLLGDSSVTIQVGTIYIDAGATATDDIDGDISDKIIVTGVVNPNVVGTYVMSYDVTDNAGHPATTVTRTVNVIDTNNPFVTFGTNGNITYAQNRSTTVTVSDAGGINASSLKYQWTTSTTAPSEASFVTGFTNGETISSPLGVTGSYYLWIIAKDNQNNTTITGSNVFNLDNIAPSITINGSNPITINQGSSYTDDGASATDAHSGINGSVTATGTVNVNVVGTYTITYNVSDNAGNAATPVTRTVNVIDPFVTQLHNKGIMTAGVYRGSTYGDFRRIFAIKNDNTVVRYQDNWSFYRPTAVDGYLATNITNAKAVSWYSLFNVAVLNSSNQVVVYSCPENSGTCTSTAMSGFGSDVIQVAGGTYYESSYNGDFKRLFALKADGTVIRYQDNWSFYRSTAVDGYLTTNITNAKAISWYSLFNVAVLNSSNQVVVYSCPENSGTCTSTAMSGFGNNVVQMTAGTYHDLSYNGDFKRIYALKADGTVVRYQDNWSFYRSTAVDGYLTTNITNAKAISWYDLFSVAVLTNDNQVVVYSCPENSGTCTPTTMSGFTNIME